MTLLRLRAILERILPGAMAAELSVLQERGHGVCLQDNELSFGSKWHKVVARVRVEEGGRIGEEYTNSITLQALRQALARARKGAQWGRPGPLKLSTNRAPSLPEANSHQEEPSPQELADVLTPIGDLAAKANFLTTASCQVLTGTFAIANTAGFAGSFSAEAATTTLTVAGADGLGVGFGFASSPGRSVDGMGAFLQAAAKSQVTRVQRPLPPGKYTVVLEPAATAGLLMASAQLFFTGALPSERPWRPPARTFSPQLTVRDDNENPRGQQQFMDFEGTAKAPLTLVNQGIIKGICLDNEIASAMGRASTGHASPPGYSTQEGPFPRHLVLESGSAMVDDMIASTERGILVTRLHGLACLDPLRALITGATTGGALLIEDGRLTQALPDLRFIQDLGEALTNIEMIGDEAEFFGGLWGGYLAPALKISKFTFLPAPTPQS